MENKIIKIANKAIYEAISKELIGYNKPLSQFVNAVMLEHEEHFKNIINESVSELLNAESFKQTFKNAMHEKLAKILINKMSGELEKKVNELKQDPTSRAKITLTLDKLMTDILQS